MRYTVLTYIFDGYERVHEVAEKDPDAEYILVTDDKDLKSETWDVIAVPEMMKLSPFDRCYWVRHHPFNYAKTDIVVRVDGSIGIKKPLLPLVDAVIDGGYDRCLMIHPDRNTIPEEYDAWCHYRGYPLKDAAKCMLLMEKMGYDFKCRGLYQGGFEVVMDTKVNDDLNELTYDILRYLGTKDVIERVNQTVFSFVANHLFSDRLKVLPVSERIITNGDLMQLYAHNSSSPVVGKVPTAKPYLFDSPCSVWR